MLVVFFAAINAGSTSLLHCKRSLEMKACASRNEEMKITRTPSRESRLDCSQADLVCWALSLVSLQEVRYHRRSRAERESSVVNHKKVALTAH